MLKRFKRWRRVGGMGVISAVVLWVGYIAATRWNGKPVRPARPATTQPTIDDLVFAFPLDPARDRTAELSAALAALPGLPIVTLPPPPEGMEWRNPRLQQMPIQPDDALNGAWTPASRPSLQSLIDYLDQPATAAALEQFVAIEPGMVRLPPDTPHSVQMAANLLIARARRHHAATNDIDAALADLAAVYRLGGLLLETGEGTHFIWGILCLEASDREMLRMAFEHRMTRHQAERARKMMQQSAVAPDRVRQIADASWRVERERLLDSVYTKDSNGNGWLVLSGLKYLQAFDPADSPRSGAWNLCSVFFNDRRTVERKLLRLYQAAGRPANGNRIDAVNSVLLEFSFLDGPLGFELANSVSFIVAVTLNQSASREAAIAALALSAYRTEHGAWPADLEALRGDYLAELPRDPYGDGPLRYRRLADEDAYLLYSVWADGADDGGVAADDGMMYWNLGTRGDRPLTITRRTPYFEPELVEAAK